MNSKEVISLLEISYDLIDKSLSIEGAYEEGLGLICKAYDWPVGHVFVMDRSNSELVSSRIWYLENGKDFETFKKISEVATFQHGSGLPGRVLSSKKPHWIADVTKDDNFPRAKEAENIGVKAAFAFPIIVSGKVIAVWEFFAKDAFEADKELLTVIDAVGSQISRVIERISAEEYKEKARNIAIKSARAVQEVENDLANFSEVHKLVEKGLDEISDIIEDLSMISLNAKIEAVKLGKEAARFNIVANEIGRMSINMKSSGNEVRQKLMTSQENNLSLVQRIKTLTELLQEVQSLRD